MTKPLTPARIERSYRIQATLSWAFIGFSALYAPVGPVLLLNGVTGLTLWFTPVFAALWVATAILWLKTAKTNRETQYIWLKAERRAENARAELNRAVARANAAAGVYP